MQMAQNDRFLTFDLKCTQADLARLNRAVVKQDLSIPPFDIPAPANISVKTAETSAIRVS